MAGVEVYRWKMCVQVAGLHALDLSLVCVFECIDGETLCGVSLPTSSLIFCPLA